MPALTIETASNADDGAIDAIGAKMLKRTAVAVGSVAGGFILFAAHVPAAAGLLFLAAAIFVGRSVLLAIKADSLRKTP